jgi:hypothetical protein
LVYFTKKNLATLPRKGFIRFPCEKGNFAFQRNSGMDHFCTYEICTFFHDGKQPDLRILTIYQLPAKKWGKTVFYAGHEWRENQYRVFQPIGSNMILKKF